MTGREGSPGDPDQGVRDLCRRVHRHRTADPARERPAPGVDRGRAADVPAAPARLGVIQPSEPGGTVGVPSPETIVEALVREKAQLERYVTGLDEFHRQLVELVERFLPPGSRGNCDVELQLLSDGGSVAAYLDTATQATQEGAGSVEDRTTASVWRSG